MSLAKKRFLRFTSIILIVIYCSQLCLKGATFFYYLKNKDFISKNLCINKKKPRTCCKGSCRLNDWMKKTDDVPMEKKSSSVPSSLNSKTESFALPLNGLGILNLFATDTCHFFNFSCSLLKGFLSKLFKPPDFDYLILNF
ncbi:MAG: hypothetical protein N3F09_07175 [Bacteroidia bacterium]|nr:hypothetical protein [Bacteroidia bacterium]